MESEIVGPGKDFHTSGIDHGHENLVALPVEIAEHGLHRYRLKRGDADEGHILCEAESFGQREADAQTCVGAGTDAYGHRVERHLAPRHEVEAVFDKRSQTLGVLHAFEILTLKLHHPLRGDSDAAYP